MNGTPRVAVIVPAFNAERTIACTLDSILAQTWKNVEAWVVDDGSSDSTASIVDGYEVRDPRVRLIRQENSGPYLARANALRRIDADYFAFVDSDDTIEPDMYETMIRFAEDNGLDVVKCDICGWREGDKEEIFRTKEEIYRNFIIPQLYEGRGNALITDKIYRSRCRPDRLEEIHSLAFEDVLLNMQIFTKVESYGHIHREFYHYILNTQSTTNTFRVRDVADFAEVIGCRRKFCKPLGLDPGGRAFHAWIVLNAGNMLYKATYARDTALPRRYGNIVGIVHLKDVERAVEDTAGGDDPRHRRLQLQFARKFTVAYIVWTRLMAAMYATYAFARKRLIKK